MKRALLLNATYEPLHFISDEKAVILVYRGRAEIVQFDGRMSTWPECFRTPSTVIAVPATLRLLTKVNKRWKKPRFRKKALFNRDNWECQYCGCALNWETVTIDHVVPRSKGGETSWRNCVSSCRKCNRKKANLSPKEANMALRTAPIEPNPYHFWDSERTINWHDDWSLFITRGDGKN